MEGRMGKGEERVEVGRAKGEQLHKGAGCQERKCKEMEREKEDRGKGRRLRQVSSSEVSEMRGVKVFIDTIVL